MLLHSFLTLSSIFFFQIMDSLFFYLCIFLVVFDLSFLNSVLNSDFLQIPVCDEAPSAFTPILC